MTKPIAVGNYDTMRNYLDGMDIMLRDAGVEHFAAREILLLRKAPHGPIYAAPPLPLWDNLVQVCKHVAEPLRARLGVPLKVLNGYRPPDYNAAVEGSPRSSHLTCHALDVTVGDADNDGDIDSHDRALLRAAAADMFVESDHATKLGIGFYQGNIHIEWGRRRLYYASKGSDLDDREIAAAMKRLAARRAS